MKRTGRGGLAKLEGQQRKSNVGLYLALIMLVIWGVYLMSSMGSRENTLTHNEYQQLLTDGKIESVVIAPNKETPTGEL